MNGEIIDYYSLTLKDVTVKKPATPVLKKVSSVSQRVTDQNRQEDNQKMQQAYDKDYA